MSRFNRGLALGQHLMSTGISCMDFISINSACYQSLTEDLLQVRGLSTVGKEGSLCLG